jgi:DNA-binding MarR family transcriptional regulator
VDRLEQDLEEMTSLIPGIVGAFQRRFSRQLARFGLTLPQFVALNVLEEKEGETRMGPLANATMQSAASMTGIVDRLLERGLVERERHPDDRRSVLVHLTDRGRQLLIEVRQDRHEQVRRMLGQLSLEERQLLFKVMWTITEIEEEEETAPENE